MPGLTDSTVDLAALSASWPCSRIIREPLALVDTLFSLQPPSSHTSSDPWGVPSFIRHAFALPSVLPAPASSSLLSIPALPSLDSTLPPPPSSSLVRFRGLVHDTHSSDYYLGAYLTSRGAGWRTGKYRDVVRVGDGEDVDDASMKTFERANITLVEVPGENAWVKAALDGAQPPQTQPQPTRGARKRPMMDDGEEAGKAMETDEESAAVEPVKRSRSSDSEVDATSQSSVAASPRGVIVTLYDVDVNALRVGEVVDVVGVYSLTPQLISDDELAFNAIHTNHHIHCITFIRHSPSSPLLLSPLSSDAVSTVAAVRAGLLAHLTSVCGGDTLTARLVLLVLISRVQTRNEDMVIGKLTVNVMRSPPALLPALAAFASKLLPYSLTIPVTISRLNEGPLYPQKNYNTDALSPSPLQCKARTLLLVDETGLTEGALTPVGLRNVQALSTLLQQQTLVYDFVYHDLNMNVDVNAVVLSKDKSLLATTLRVAWRGAEGKVGDVDEREWGVWREWVQRAGEGDFMIGKEMGTRVESEFVRRRKENAKVEAEWLHRLLLITRLLASSYGEGEWKDERLTEGVELMDEMEARERL